ncbi:MAG: hypothetical protein ACN4GR_03105 [Arenicellales bacterium]
MAYLYFTITAVFLYLFSDWLLNKIEAYYGKRLEYRSVIFFVIIMVLAVGSFEIIDRIVGEPQQASPTPQTSPAKK